jgi:hypothetical protein
MIKLNNIVDINKYDYFKDNYFKDNNILNKKDHSNKCLLIDYFIIIKLIFKKIGLHMNNYFYKNITLYLTTEIEYNFKNIKLYKYYFLYYDYYYISYHLYDFIYKFNLKKNLITAYLKNYLNIINENNFYINSYIYNNYIDNIKILNISFHIYHKNLIFNNTLFKIHFEIPYYLLDNIDIKNFKDFDNFIIQSWENTFGIVMYDYFTSPYIIKHIHFDIFKKIILRLFRHRLLTN